MTPAADLHNDIIEDAVAEAMALNLCFLSGPGQSRHVPFTLSPSPITTSTLLQLEAAAPLLGSLTQALAECDDLIREVHQPLVPGDAFFCRNAGYAQGNTLRWLQATPATPAIATQ